MVINAMGLISAPIMMVIATKMSNQKSLKKASILLAFLLVSCEKSKTHQSDQDTSSKLSISIDTIYTSVDLFSMQGYFRVANNKIYYIQPELQNILKFDSLGRFESKLLGSGKGPDKANGDLDYHGFKADGKNVFLGSNYIFKTFDATYSQILEKTPLTWINRKQKYNTKDLTNASMYDYHYRDEPFIDSQWLPITNEDDAVIPVNINSYINPIANLTKRPENFFGEAFTVGVVDLKNGVLKHVFRKHPEEFSKHKWLYFYNYPYRAIDENYIYVSDRLGPDIQVYTIDDYELVETFGNTAPALKGRLDKYDSYEDFLSALGVDITLKYGYYLQLFVDQDLGYIFRSYHVKNFDPWGLQVYNAERELIADFEVPFRFNVIGKIGDFYYADGIRDEKNEILGIYKFRLEKK